MTRIVKAAGGLKVRSGPGKVYAELGEVADGAAVEVLETDPVGGVWQRVLGGWVHGGYLVERATGGPRRARALAELLRQVNTLAPRRSKASDGWIASEQHHAQNPTSDHEVNEDGVVTAQDITHDPVGGCNAVAIVRSLVDSRDPRIKYVIYNRQMWRSYAKPGLPAWRPAPYTGKNPHTHHVHVSVVSDPALYDDPRSWSVAVQ